MKCLKSSLLSAWFMAVRLDFRECLWGYIGFVKGMAKWALRIGAADPSTVARRNASCRCCPMFDGKRGTCGKLGETFIYPNSFTNRKRVVSFGCWCFVEFSNRFASKDCWARAHGLEIGWPDELRPPEEH